MRPDIMEAEEQARALLLNQNPAVFPVRILGLRLPGAIRFDSMQNFCRITNSSMEQLCAGSDCLRDGCTFVMKKQGSRQYLVLYNNRENRRRLNFTLAHEVGHILLEHERDGDIEERAANAFAAELLMPRVLVCKVTGKMADAAVIAGVFKTSLAAARLRVNNLTRREPTSSEWRLLSRYGILLPDGVRPVSY